MRVWWTSNLAESGSSLLSEVFEALNLDASAGPSAGTTRHPPRHPPRIAVFIDSNVKAAHPELERLLSSLLQALPGIGAIRHFGVPGGEHCKNDPDVLAGVLRDIQSSGLCRKSIIIAVGGGAVLDVVGFAAATAHRGIRLIRLPTTTLSQADSAAGVKNGVNLFGQKNYLGTFAVPDAVLCDESLLNTLSDEHWRAGFSEAVKVALVRDAAFLSCIEQAALDIRARSLRVAGPMLRKSLIHHLDHISGGGDPFERTHARPLDHGHWAAHRLETLSGFQVSHGDAVAIGIAIDAMYAHRIGMLSPQDRDRVIGVLTSLGFDLGSPWLADPNRLLEGLEQFREHLGGELSISLLRGIGLPEEVHEIDMPAMGDAILAVRGL